MHLLTSLRVAALAVLELSGEHTEHLRGLDSSVPVRRLPAAPAISVDRHVVCVIVPGNGGTTPSAAGKNTRPSS